MMRAIAIDDEPLALEVIRSHATKVPFLELEGVFTDAFEGLDFLQKHPVDLLFLDIKMPVLDGFELCKKIREIDKIVYISFITASDAYYKKFRSQHFPELGKINYIQKPIGNEGLLQIVKTIIGRRTSPVAV